jgi:pimeloyl-ACP methyl ester carboxylesterase
MEIRVRLGALGCGLLVSIVLLTVPACGQQESKEMDEMVDIGAHSLHIRCRGSGRPTVVIDTGAGDLAAKWYSVQDRLAQLTHVCTYDRAGYGQSEPGPMPRHAQQAASELKLLLEEAGLKGPYVLVGHSLGGLNLQVFADQYPDLVAGLVLLDPPARDFIAGRAFPDLYQMLEQAGAEMVAAAEHLGQSSDAGERAKADYAAAVASEHQSLAESAVQVAAVASFGDIPLTVMASGKPNPAFGDEAQAFQAFWIEQSRALAEKSANGTFLLVEESGHHLQVDVPDVVVAAIREIVAKVQG